MAAPVDDDEKTGGDESSAREAFGSIFDEREAPDDDAEERSAKKPEERRGKTSGKSEEASDEDDDELFDLDDDDLEDEGDDADEDDDDGKEAKGGKPGPVPYARLQKAITQRNAARDELATANRELGKLRTASAQGQEILDLYAKAGLEDPVGQAKWDARFFASVAALKSDPRVQPALRLILDHVRNGKVDPMAKGNEEKKTDGERDAKPAKPDATVQKLLRRDAESTIGKVLETAKVKPELRRVISNDVLGRVEDLADFDGPAALKLVKTVIAENGWTPAFVRGAADEKKPKSPPAGRAAGAPASGGDDKGQDSKEQAPKNSREFGERQRRRLAEELGAGRESAA